MGKIKSLMINAGILHKHKYRFFRRIRWFEDSYQDGCRTKLCCTICGKIVNSNVELIVCESTLDLITYEKEIASLNLRRPISKLLNGYRPNDDGHMWVIGKPTVKP